MENNTAARVGWSVGPNGYMIQVLDEDNQPIEEARFGNNPLSDAACDELSPDDPKALNRDVLEEYALAAAKEIAIRHSVSPDFIFYDEDQEKILAEEYEEFSGAGGNLKL